MKIDINIKELRKHKNMSLQQLADISGVRYATLHKYENQPTNVNLVILADIAAALEISNPDELFSFEDTDD